MPSPQALDYFASVDAAPGGIVQISLNHRKLLGIVLAAAPVSELRQAVKRSSFRLKPIEKIICGEEVIPKIHLKLIIWTSQYYYTPLGLMAKTFLPRYFAQPTKKFLSELSVFNIGPPTSKTRLSIVPELYKIDLLQNKNPDLKYAAVIHGGISAKNEWAIWKLARQGGIKDIIGTRSAFAIGLSALEKITVYDAESPYHKSFDQQPYINAKNVAVKLAELTATPIVLEGQFSTKASSIPASIQVIDMKSELKNGNYSIFSKQMQVRLKKTIEENKQAVLFINRRGLSTGLLCRDCGNVVKCPNCDAPFVYHNTKYLILDTNTKYQLLCHHCGQRKIPPSVCPNCQSYKIKFIGTGTQRVEGELRKLFPNAPSERLDLDIAPKWTDQQRIFDKFRAKKFSILIGTQLILKEELLPRVDLAAIVTIDPLLSLPDFRMGEQIAKIIDMLLRTSKTLPVQTYKPDNEIFKCLLESEPDNFYSSWLAQELENRKALSFPPFSQIINLTYAHADTQKAEQEAKILMNKLGEQARNYQLPITSCQLLGPAPAFIPLRKNRYIWQIMIKSKIEDLRIRNKLLSVVPSDWKIDVDPVTMV